MLTSACLPCRLLLRAKPVRSPTITEKGERVAVSRNPLGLRRAGGAPPPADVLLSGCNSITPPRKNRMYQVVHLRLDDG
jgi:hypothetical protein